MLQLAEVVAPAHRLDPPIVHRDLKPANILVHRVSWNDASAFCDWLGQQESGAYRLPTEAEWEYACRAGTTTRYHSGDDPETLVEVGNVADATARMKFRNWTTMNGSDACVLTAPVGQYRPNAFSLYNIHGNVWEWCWDVYNADYYKHSPTSDPRGPGQAAPGDPGRELVRRSAVRGRRAGSARTRQRGRLLGFRVAQVQSGR